MMTSKSEVSPSLGTERDRSEKDSEKEYLEELFNFSCILRGEVKHLEKIKEYIVREYVEKRLVKLIKPTYDKKEIYILTEEQWKLTMPKSTIRISQFSLIFLANCIPTSRESL